MSFNELDLVILKTIVTNKKHALDFANEQDAKLFHSDVWNCANLIVNYIKTYKDLPTLRIITERIAKGNNSKLIDHVNKVWESFSKIEYDDREYRHDLDKLKRRFAEKQISIIKDSLSKLDPGSVDISKTIGEMQKTIQTIHSLEEKKSFENKNVKDYLQQFVDNFNAKKENPDFDRGIKTYYSFIDHATNGLKPADFVIIAGESGFGKSLFLQNIAIQTWLQADSIQNVNFSKGKNIIYFSLEMPYEDCFNRFISRLSGVPSRDIENATLNKEDFKKVKDALDFIKKFPFQFRIIDITDVCSNDLERILNDSGEEFDSIFIDYLGIMKPNKSTDEGEQDWLKQGIISYEIRAVARKYKKPIFSAVQLNRKNPNKESSENIGLARLARSKEIATHATHVIQIENRSNEENYPDFLYHFIKNRKGPKGKGALLKNLPCAHLFDKEANIDFYDIDFINQEDISDEIEKLEI
jgi:replicative DNA helicase